MFRVDVFILYIHIYEGYQSNLFSMFPHKNVFVKTEFFARLIFLNIQSTTGHGYKTFIMLNSAEHKIQTAHK